MIAADLALATIERIEAQAALAWPAARSVVIGDWLVRLSDGYTRRANAASAVRPNMPLRGSLAAIEAAYAAHGRPAQFRLTPLADPDSDVLLAQAGYRTRDPSVVMVAPSAIERDIGPGCECLIDPRPTPSWLALSGSIAGRDPIQAAAHAALVARIAQPTAFATVFADGVAVGVGIGVLGDGMVGLFDLAIASAHRGRGHGRAVVTGLRRWAGSLGAATVWLQVAEDNDGAMALYAAMGFTAAYRYHYRVAAGASITG